MNIVIIEDELYTADYLKELLTEADPNIQVIKMLSGVQEAVHYFENNYLPLDLIFCDIHLADGSGFEIFNQTKIEIPVVFVTAYDQYALQAFKVNSIDYILKPFNKKSIAEALHKFQGLYASIIKKVFSYEKVIQDAANNHRIQEPTSILIKYREKIKPVKIADIAFFITKNKCLHLLTFKNENYTCNKSLEEIEKICGAGFYRVNRQVLLNKNAIDEVRQTYSRKLLVKLKITDAPVFEINKTKMSHFLSWLAA